MEAVVGPGLGLLPPPPPGNVPTRVSVLTGAADVGAITGDTGTAPDHSVRLLAGVVESACHRG